MKKRMKKLLSLALCVAMLLGLVVNVAPVQKALAAVNIGENPSPKIDIAVNVPDDYPGDFDSFRAELTAALEAQGIDTSLFRITDTAAKIDTTNLDGWYVYDHYWDQTTYNNLVASDQRTKQPYRIVDNTKMDYHKSVGGYKTPMPIQEVFVEKKFANVSLWNAKLWPFDRHIYSWADAITGAANMIFAGYGTYNKLDFMVYPATSDTRRTVEFDLDCGQIDPHTLLGAGFLLNAAVTSDKHLKGYALYYQWDSSGNATPYIAEIKDYNAMAYATNGNANGEVNGDNFLTSVASSAGIKYTGKTSVLSSGTKIRIKVILTKDSVIVTQQTYQADGSLGPAKYIFDPSTNMNSNTANGTAQNGKIDLPVNESYGYGFGPFVAYKSHGCQNMTFFQFGDLQMTYAQNAFDALKNVQYYEGAEYKYFINLSGGTDANIPDEAKEAQSYVDGINRMNTNEIFYISNASNGMVLVEDNGVPGHLSLTGKDEQGTTHANGQYCLDQDYVSQMAKYIADNYKNEVPFYQAPIDSDIPLANFYVTNTTDAQNITQLMTVHLQHLKSVKGTKDDRVAVNIADKSLTNKDGDPITKWTLKVYDPNGNTMPKYGGDTGLTATSTVNVGTSAKPIWQPAFKYPSNMSGEFASLAGKDFTGFELSYSAYEAKSLSTGRYTLELTVEDTDKEVPTEHHTSAVFQTYLTIFVDDKAPNVTISNSTKKNIANIHMEDAGQGIAADGITFMEDNRGSGIAAYCITDSAIRPEDTVKANRNGVKGWVDLASPTHELDLSIDIRDYKDWGAIYVYYRDECGNYGEQGIAKPVHVKVQDAEGNDLDDYYVVNQGDITYLPENAPPDPSEEGTGEFSSWVTGDSDDPITEGDNVQPGENGEIVIKPSYTTEKAPLYFHANANKEAVITYDTADNPSAEQGEDTYGKYLKIDVLLNSSVIGKVNDIGPAFTREGWILTKWTLDQRGDVPIGVAKVTDQSNGTHIYAQWEKAKYTLSFDKNGGTGGPSTRQVEYATNIDAFIKANFAQNSQQPSKKGYLFTGWKYKSDENPNQLVDFNSSKTMPAHDLTLIAQWKTDPDAFFYVSFNTKGGNNINDQVYEKGSSVYTNLPTPVREGYNFAGWYKEEGYSTKAESGGAMTSASHTLYAKWEPAPTNIYVDYYVYRNETWVKVDSLRETVDGYKTEDSFVLDTVLEGHKHTDLGHDSQYGKDLMYHYWLNTDKAITVNGEPANEVSKVTPNMTIELYYNRYFDITVEIDNNGTVTSSSGRDSEATLTGSENGVNKYVISHVKQGETPSMTWAAAEGYHVTKVLVDGVAKDSLISDRGVSFESIAAEHTVKIMTAKNGEDNPGGAVGTSYLVDARIEGCQDPRACFVQITGGQNTDQLEPGLHVTYQTAGVPNDIKVAWTIDREYYIVTEILIDGESVPVDQTDVTFASIGASHDVVVKVQKLPANGGSTSQGYYTVTVNRYGGNDDVTVTPVYTAVEKNKNVNVRWDATTSATWNVYKVLINGKDIRGTEDLQYLQTQVSELRGFKAPSDLNTGTIYLSKVNQNFVIDIYLKDIEAESGAPKYDDTTWPRVTAHIQGGPGTVYGDIGNVEKGKPATINWTINTNTDPTSADYTYYEVDYITINGKKVPESEYTDKSITRVINESTVGIIYLKPATYNVNVIAYGNGTVTDSTTLWKGQSAKITGTPTEGSKIAKVVVDGETVYPTSTLSFTPPDENITNTSYTESAMSVDINSIDKDHTVVVYFTENGDVQEIPENLHNVTTSSNVPTKINDPAIVKDGTEHTISWTVPAGYELDEIIVADSIDALEDGDIYGINGTDVTKPATPSRTVNISITDGPDGTRTITISNITKDAHVAFNFVKASLGENNDQLPVESNETYTITAIAVGEGSVSGDGVFNKDTVDTAKVTWVANKGAEVQQIRVDGEWRPDLIGTTSYTFDDKKDHEIIVYFKQATIAQDKMNKDVDEDGIPDINIDINGDGIPDLNIDDDGDGIPDRNIVDKNGDGKPDTSKDVEGITPENWREKWGEKDPDVNIDTNGDGKPDLNIDTDGDGVPDINIDTDNDGEPDLNVDTTGDGKPDTNIVDRVENGGDEYPDEYPFDEDGEQPDTMTPDGQPDTSKDWHKPSGNWHEEIEDLTPNVNVEDQPDVDVDVTGDGVPDINIDVDGDGIPDLNIDTDGDGLPDLNIVIDSETGEPKDLTEYWDDEKNQWKEPENPDDPQEGEGPFITDVKPDLNILDKDGDGEWDKSDSWYDKDKDTSEDKENHPNWRDQAKDLTPDVNIDTDGDGKPDVNIDTTGDGVPDINIDKDGDGKPDVNIDNTGNNEPDFNIVDTWKDGKDGNPDNTWDTSEDWRDPAEPNWHEDVKKLEPNTNVTDGKNPDVNIDTDGDGIPDINIDIDGDGKPDYNIDTDGDGKPDLNIIDTDMDGKPDNLEEYWDEETETWDPELPKPTVNVVDKNGDGKPDTSKTPKNKNWPNVDPDLNVDTDGDGIPDINIDVDGDGKPDLNIDTDGDGKPDTNIVDKDGDGEPDDLSQYWDEDDQTWYEPSEEEDPEEKEPLKPDVNIDVGGPKKKPDNKPDVNVDTDGDGIPDINIDTDGDGVPDLNIDTDGDGKPDINIDTDGDGEPDVNITDDDLTEAWDEETASWKPVPKPKTNVDTNGDGIPDINIDTDGDGDPDINIDTNDDGKPDENIDSDGDGKPDVNVTYPNENYPDGEDNDGDGIIDGTKPEEKFPYDPEKPDINVDTDGDGIPDLNIDTDGDGEPDVNIDTNGDGKPDLNVDTTGDYKPDLNIDTDGDGEPDLNIDTDGDGKPDVNVDTNGDGEPDINIDINGDGKPDINIDDDGDGKPDRNRPDRDVNIDTNGDGIPDLNVDLDGDGVPDINIDTDGDGIPDKGPITGDLPDLPGRTPDINIDLDGDRKPDLNVDTNHDGKPDLNVDTNGDGKPDLNVDTDGDGEPDINIDTDGDGKPDENVTTGPDAETNVDTDGDGLPDINVDTNGDGKPDVNIDTTGDGKPDLNIVDKDGDGKPDDLDEFPRDEDGKIIDPETGKPLQPDVNIDKDGDGKPDLNVDTNGDGKPDINIDTNGDGKPDLNVDEDGDGIPDYNIDTDGDGIADTNIRKPSGGGGGSTTPDPEINKDVDGDGRPDVNVDTDDDGKPDLNIDTNGDDIPDINIDTDGDGRPDVNIDTDGDGIPDINIDTNGDGIPDENIISGPNNLNTVDHTAYIFGYPDGTVGPERNITRAEVVSIFYRLLNDSVRSQYMTTSNPYPDVNEGAWYNTAVSTMSAMGIVKGYPDGTFKPNDPITRAEFVTIAAGFFEYPTQIAGLPFSDVPSGHWAEKTIKAAAAVRFITGYPNGTFKPNGNITRAEAISIVNRVLGRVPHMDGMYADMITWSDNMNTGAWYYAAIQEATNSHEYIRDLLIAGKVQVFERWTAKLADRAIASNSANNGELVEDVTEEVVEDVTEEVTEDETEDTAEDESEEAADEVTEDVTEDEAEDTAEEVTE